jgi:SAM-dependent methyltransferase
LQGVDRDAAVLEVGCGEGQVLDMLATLGFTDLMGCDINETALARAAPTYRGICADISSLPFSDETYDLVLTSGTLIHVLPMAALRHAVSELKRVSRRWLAGFEYWAKEPTGIAWRGQLGILWKCDFPSVLAKAGLSLARTAYETHISGDIDCAYLATK